MTPIARACVQNGNLTQSDNELVYSDEETHNSFQLHRVYQTKINAHRSHHIEYFHHEGVLFSV